MRTSPAFAILALSCLSCGYQPRSTYAHATKTPEAKSAPTTKTTSKRSVVSFGRVVGSDVATIDPDGAVVVTVDVLENGRGPHVDATIKLAPNGTISAFDARGHHEMGTPIEEAFAREGGHAHWKSKEEAGDRDNAAGSFFVPMADVPDALGLLARALLTNNGSIKLLPDGEAKIEKTGDATVHGKGGKDRHVVGYAITGLELTPTRLWMNDDGTWFGFVNPWWSVVPEGWEGTIDALVEKQNALDRARDATLATTLAHKPPPAGLAYTHARVLDVERGVWRADQTVVVVGDVIKSVGRGPAPAGAEVIDLAGKALVPGLWDMHSHLGDGDGVLDVASGVTTARDVGNDPDKLDDFKKRFDDGSAIGPRVYRMGFIEGRGDKSASSKVTAENEQEALAAVDFYQKRGYDGIKIYNSMKPELVPILAKEAHARGMSVTGHIPVHMLANEAVRAGYDGIEHINMLFLNFFATHDTDTRDTTRFTLVGDKAASFDLKSKPAQEFFALLKEKKTIIDPTVGVFETLLNSQQGKIVPGLEPMVARLPVQTQRGYLSGGLPLDDKQQLYKDSFEKVLAMIKVLYDQKIPLVIGTDAMAGLWVHHEMALFVRAGVPAAAVMRMATIDAAKSMKLDAKTGSIAEGKAADMVVIDGDPLARIDDIGKVVSTMRGGVVFPAKELYDSVGVKPMP